jgi:hypothetical protein
MMSFTPTGSPRSRPAGWVATDFFARGMSSAANAPISASRAPIACSQFLEQSSGREFARFDATREVERVERSLARSQRVDVHRSDPAGGDAI